MKYVCDVCGYVYDPAVGDPENGVAPGTPWEEVPEDWLCRCARSVRTSSARKRKKSSAGENACFLLPIFPICGNYLFARTARSVIY